MLRRRRRRWCNLVNHKSWRGYESFRDQPARSVTKQNQLKIAAKLKVGDWKLKFFTLQVSQYRLFLLCYCHHLPLVRREFLQFWTKKKKKKKELSFLSDPQSWLVVNLHNFPDGRNTNTQVSNAQAFSRNEVPHSQILWQNSGFCWNKAGNSERACLTQGANQITGLTSSSLTKPAIIMTKTGWRPMASIPLKCGKLPLTVRVEWSRAEPTDVLLLRRWMILAWKLFWTGNQNPGSDFHCKAKRQNKIQYDRMKWYINFE